MCTHTHTNLVHWVGTYRQTPSSLSVLYWFFPLPLWKAAGQRANMISIDYPVYLCVYVCVEGSSRANGEKPSCYKACTCVCLHVIPQEAYVYNIGEFQWDCCHGDSTRDQGSQRCLWTTKPQRESKEQAVITMQVRICTRGGLASFRRSWFGLSSVWNQLQLF